MLANRGVVFYESIGFTLGFFFTVLLWSVQDACFTCYNLDRIELMSGLPLFAPV